MSYQNFRVTAASPKAPDVLLRALVDEAATEAGEQSLSAACCSTFGARASASFGKRSGWIA